MTNDRKSFHGIRTQEGARVWVQTRNAMFPLPPRNDVHNHSPDGFEWGYGGSGPAQLALAICLELLEGNAPRALAVYQDVKWRFVGSLSGDVWELDGATVLEYIGHLESLATAFEVERVTRERESDATGFNTGALEREEEELRRNGPHDDARVRQAEGDAYGVDNEPT